MYAVRRKPPAQKRPAVSPSLALPLHWKPVRRKRGRELTERGSSEKRRSAGSGRAGSAVCLSERESSRTPGPLAVANQGDRFVGHTSGFHLYEKSCYQSCFSNCCHAHRKRSWIPPQTELHNVPLDRLWPRPWRG